MTADYREQYAKYSRYFNGIKTAYEKRAEVRISINLLMTLLAISFFSLLALRPTLATIAELVSNVNSQQDISTKLDEKISNLQKAHATWTKETQREFLVDQALPKEPQPDLYLRQIEGLIAKNKVALTALSIQNVLILGKEVKKTDTKTETKGGETSDGVNYVDLSFSAEGLYPQLFSFLEGLENLRRTMKIQTLSLGQNKATQSSNIILTINGKVPYYEVVKK